jgi:aminopeptidase
MDPRIEKLADVMVNYSIKLKKGDLFKIQAPYLAMPLVRAVYVKAMEKGANPYVKVLTDDIQELFYKLADEEQLAYVPEIQRVEIDSIDAFLHIWASENTKYLSNTDPLQQQKAQVARKELVARYFERTAAGELRWCGTLFPNNAMAQDAEMSLTEFEDFVYEAGHCSDEDPAAFWIDFSKQQQKLCNALGKLSTIHIKGDGTDLKLNVAGRTWVNCDGQENFPDGEVFTSPIEDSANGHITYTYPACYQGREVEKVELTFKDGLVTDFKAAKNVEFLKAMLETDPGARRIGELAVGTNYNIQQFTKNTLFDEKIGGTCHLAVGRSLPESGGKNESSIHWDMVCELRNGGEIYGDGELIYKDGKFVEGFGA